ncbi:MAG: hypothetical protein JF609_03355 [Verrucomicrobia bacterium]|nr:hypothetical protein [Verrucomicrobiota bacterium]
MKSLKTLLSCLFAAAIALLLSTGSAFAQLVAYDEADNYVVSANWTNGANQGFGFTPWAIVTNGPDFHGTYLVSANSPVFSIATTTNVSGTNYPDVWALFANGPTDVNTTTAYRGFNNPLGTNTFKLQWGSRGAGVTTTTNSGNVHGWCGFTLRNGNDTNAAANFEAGARLYVYFLDGANPSTVYIEDGSQPFFGQYLPTSVPGTSFSDLGRGNITNAIQAEVTVGTDGDTYHLVLKDCVQNRTLFVTDNVLIPAGSGTIDSVAMFCKETTGDQVYNRMQIAVPHVAPSIVNLQPTNTSLFVDATVVNNFSFEVKSMLSTVISSAVSVTLNGIPQPSLVFSTASPTNDLMVTDSTPLAPDTFYTCVVVAQDANGDTTTNTSTFNTFLPTDLYIDCGDYNYTVGTVSGQFVNSSTPANSYSSFTGSNNVDFFETDLSGTNNAYRSGDLPQVLFLATDSTGDPVPHAGGGFTIYSLGFTVASEWQNYTRVVPASTNYSIYARAASVNGGQFEISRLTNAVATTTNQPLAALGRVNVPRSGGSRVHSGQLTPLTDMFGNTVVVPLTGTNTLRCTAISNQGYNLEYLLVVADTNNYGTLRPYISSGSPVPNATGFSTTGKINFNIANRQTTVASVQAFLNGTNYTGAVVLTNNLAGTTVFISPTNLLVNTNNTLKTIITDNLGATVTNSWTFFTAPTVGNGVWTGGASPDLTWAVPGNWAGGVPGPGFNATIASTGGSTFYTTNSIVTANVSVAGLTYATNLNGYHTTWIQDGVTLTVTNNSTATMQVIQFGGGGLNADNSFNQKVTNTITGGNGTLVIAGNPLGSANVNALNFQVRQNANGAFIPNLVTLDMSGLGTLSATVGKFYVAQGGSGGFQTNVSGCVYLARTNYIICLRPGNAGSFEVGDSSGGIFTSPGSSLYLGITNGLYLDTVRFGKNKATNTIITFNPAFTNLNPSVYMRGTNGANFRFPTWTIGDADNEATLPNFVQANVDFTSGRLDALAGNVTLGRGETTTGDTGFALGKLTFTAGILDALNVTNGWQRNINTATETGLITVNGTAVLACPNIVLAQAFAGANASLVTGTLNVTNGTIRGNVFAGGGVSTVNLNGGTLVVSNSAGTAAAPLTALNLTSAALRLKVDGTLTSTNIAATTITTSGTSTITIYSVSNVVSSMTNHLISYTGGTPFAGLSLAPLPSGYSGSLVDNGGSIDLVVNVAVSKPPTIRNITISGGGQVIIGGTNNVGAGGTYTVLTATNLLTPLVNWLVLTNGNFDASGNFSSTNTAGTNSQRYFMLKVP